MTHESLDTDAKEFELTAALMSGRELVCRTLATSHIGVCWAFCAG